MHSYSYNYNCDCSLQTFRPVVRSHVAQPLVLELDMDSDDIGDDTTEPDSNETHLYGYETDQDF